MRGKKPKCAWCGKKVGPSGMAFEFDFIGNPEVVWHTTRPAPETDCSSEDDIVKELYELYLVQEKSKLGTGRVPGNFRYKAVKILRKVHARGPGRVKVATNGLWRL